MEAINKQIIDARHFDPKTGEGKTHLTDDQVRKFGLEYEMLRRAYEAQSKTTAALEAQEAEAEQLKGQAIERERAIRAYGNGDAAREQALRDQLAELEAKGVAATIHATFRR